MSVLIYRDAQSVGTCAAVLVASHLLSDPKCVIGVDYHEVLLPVFETLSDMTDSGLLNWSDAQIYQLYEFLPAEDGEQRIANLLGKALFAKTDISEKQYAVPFSSELTPEEISATFERSILNDGGLDVALLAVRQDGALLMNTSVNSEPGTHREIIDTDGFITSGLCNRHASEASDCRCDRKKLFRCGKGDAVRKSNGFAACCVTTSSRSDVRTR